MGKTDARAHARAEDIVTARITKMGGGKISTGEHVPGQGDRFHEAGAIVNVPRPAAEHLETRGFAEILEQARPKTGAKPE